LRTDTKGQTIVGAVFSGASFFHRWHGHLLPFVFSLETKGGRMTQRRYSSNLLTKLRNLHDEMRECVAIYKHLNPHLDLSGWAEEELDLWHVFRCAKCDQVEPESERGENGICSGCARPARMEIDDDSLFHGMDEK
jgi:hypothetical protein